MVRGASARGHLRVISSAGTTQVPPAGVSRATERYGDLADRGLAAILAAEDTAERFGLSPYARSTCPVHRCWLHQCVTEPVHVDASTGHRWCPACECPVDVDVDESAGTVVLRCSHCGREPDTAANREVRFACRTSLSAMRAGSRAVLRVVPDE